MDAMMTMVKLDVAALEKAYDAATHLPAPGDRHAGSQD